MFNAEDYPANWEAIASGVKADANWKCESCGCRCQSPFQAPEMRKFFAVLTVHHIDRDRSHNAPVNLIALCAACHLRVEADAIARETTARHGRLPGLSDAALDVAEIRARILAGRFAGGRQQPVTPS